MSTRAQAIVGEASYVAHLFHASPSTTLLKRIEERMSALYDHALEVKSKAIILDIDWDWAEAAELLRECRLATSDVIAAEIERQITPPLEEPEEFGARILARRKGNSSLPPRLFVRVTPTQASRRLWTDGVNTLPWDQLEVTEVLG